MAYNFTASSTQYLSVADTAALDITGAITLCAWIKSTGTYGTVGKGILAKYETATNQRSYGLQINASGQASILLSADGTSANVRNEWGSTVVGTGWKHLAASYAPSTTTVAIYVDGVAESRSNNNGPLPSSIHIGTAPLWIGLLGTTSTATNNIYFDGLIAEAAIYRAALSTAQIASLAKGFAPPQVSSQNLVFYAPLVRNLQDVKGGLTITNNNTATVANHPRVYA